MPAQNKFAILLAILTLVLATLACTINVGGPDYPDTPIPVSTEAVVSLQEQFKAVIAAGAESGSAIITINETQLTSYLAFKLQAQTNPLFTDPQVYLRDGQMQIYGKAHQGYFVANVGITMAVGVDEQGEPQIEIVSVDFGPFPVPEGLTGAISAIVKEAYTGAIGPVATGFRIENIAIADGYMVMSGRVK